MSARAKVAASFVRRDASLLDVGCGAMVLRDHLPDGVRYQGIDAFPYKPDALCFDLDRHEFPDGIWDYVALIGVLSWITEKHWTLRRIRDASSNLILSRDESVRARWQILLHETAWQMVETKPVRPNLDMILCRPTDC